MLEVSVGPWPGVGKDRVYFDDRSGPSAGRMVPARAEDVLERRRQMSQLREARDIVQLENIILVEDARPAGRQDWALLTEAVAARNQIGLSDNEYIRTKYQINLHWCPEDQGRRDMHMHTLLSDGRLDIEQVMQELVKNVVKVAAITDHFVLCGVERYIELGKQYGIVIIPAIEFYCYREVDAQNHIGITGDIVAYYIDPNDAELNRIVENSARRSQLILYSYAMQLLEYLAARGELEAALAKAPAYLGLTPDEIIRKLLVDQNNYYLEVYRRNGLPVMVERVEKGLAGLTDADIDGFIALLRRINQATAPYVLSAEEEAMMFNVMFFQTSETSLTTAPLWKDVLQEYVAKIDDVNKPRAFQWGWVNISNPNAPLIIDDVQELIGAVHRAGGIALFAHPRWYPDIVFPRGGWQGDGYAVIADYIRELKVLGIDGFEVYTHWLDAAKDGYYLALAEELGLPISYGTDCHYSGKEALAWGSDGTFYMPYEALVTLRMAAERIRRGTFQIQGRKFVVVDILRNGCLSFDFNGTIFDSGRKVLGDGIAELLIGLLNAGFRIVINTNNKIEDLLGSNGNLVTPESRFILDEVEESRRVNFVIYADNRTRKYYYDATAGEIVEDEAYRQGFASEDIKARVMVKAEAAMQEMATVLALPEYQVRDKVTQIRIDIKLEKTLREQVKNRLTQALAGEDIAVHPGRSGIYILRAGLDKSIPEGDALASLRLYPQFVLYFGDRFIRGEVEDNVVVEKNGVVGINVSETDHENLTDGVIDYGRGLRGTRELLEVIIAAADLLETRGAALVRETKDGIITEIEDAAQRSDEKPGQLRRESMADDSAAQAPVPALSTTNPTTTAAWAQLQALSQTMWERSLSDMFAADPER
ncbi:MAG: PHP domain-containing protein, partial [Candidatus Omnitrophota bacterium]